MGYEEEIDDYKRTIQCLLSLRSHLEYEYGIKSLLNKNLMADEKVLSPDMVSYLLTQKKGIVTEIKNSFCRDESKWEKEFEQIKRYDQDLKGWMSIMNNLWPHEIIFLIPYQLSNKVIKNFIDWTKKKKITFNNNLVFIEFNRQTRVKNFFDLALKKGESELGITKKMDPSPVSISFEYIKEDQVRICFCDVCPPLPYLMDKIWEQVYKTLLSIQEKRTIALTRKVIKKQIIAEEIWDILVENCGPPLERGEVLQKKLPKLSWIKKALEAFRFIKLAEKKEGKYILKIKRIENSQDYFIKKLTGKETQLNKFFK